MPDIVIPFRGVDYRVPESRAFALGEAVEEVLPLTELAGWGRHVRFYKLARAVATMLRFAGARVTDAEVLAEIMQSTTRAAAGGAPAEELFAARAIASLQAVLMQAIPEGMAAGAGNPAAPAAPATDGSSGPALSPPSGA